MSDLTERCACCGGDGILNHEMKDPEPIWTYVWFKGEPNSYSVTGLVYFHRRICTDCSNRWQLMLSADCKDRRQFCPGCGEHRILMAGLCGECNAERIDEVSRP